MGRMARPLIGRMARPLMEGLWDLVSSSGASSSLWDRSREGLGHVGAVETTVRRARRVNSMGCCWGVAAVLLGCCSGVAAVLLGCSGVAVVFYPWSGCCSRVIL